MPGNSNGNSECCEIPVCLIITSVTVTKQAKEDFKELFESVCGGDDNGNGNGNKAKDHTPAPKSAPEPSPTT